MSADIDRQIDAMFSPGLPSGDEGGRLARVTDFLRPLGPVVVWLADDLGQVRCWRSEAGFDAGPLAGWAAECPPRLGDKAHAIFHHEPTGKTCVVVRLPGLGAALGALLGGLAPAGQLPEHLAAGLVCAGLLASDALEADHKAGCADVRIRHLLAEQESIKNSYAQIMASALEEREQRLQEQAQHMDHLEHEVAKRSADLREALKRAEEASRAKSAFLANMSHEIRTPMTAILGYTDLLMEESRGRQRASDWVHIVQRNGKHLLSLINDILDLSKIEAGKLEIDRTACSVFEVVGEVSDLMRARIDEKGLTYKVSWQGRFPQTIQSDPTRLRQVLVNLLGNAIKFTQQGGVEVRVEMGRRPEGPDAETIQFHVSDSGIGITGEQQSRLFQPFSQADASTTRKYGGTGLGLAISVRLAKLLGGELTVKSEPGRGSTFSFAIETGPLDGVTLVEAPPVKPAAAAQTYAKPAADALAGANILLAEDGPDNQVLLSTILRRVGAKVEVVGNGRLACDALIAARRRGSPFHLVLMDMQMPELDGYGATEEVRSTGDVTPIIALTANAMADDRQRCLDAGCDDFASKPIDSRTLIATVARHLARPGVIPQAPAPPTLLAVTAESTAGDAPIISELAGDPDMVELINEFVGHLSQWIEDLGRMKRENDLPALAKAAHQIKGSAGGYGFGMITEKAARLDAAIRNEAETGQIHVQLDELIGLCGRAVRGRTRAGNLDAPASNR